MHIYDLKPVVSEIQNDPSLTKYAARPFFLATFVPWLQSHELRIEPGHKFDWNPVQYLFGQYLSQFNNLNSPFAVLKSSLAASGIEMQNDYRIPRIQSVLDLNIEDSSESDSNEATLEFWRILASASSSIEELYESTERVGIGLRDPAKRRKYEYEILKLAYSSIVPVLNPNTNGWRVSRDERLQLLLSVLLLRGNFEIANSLISRQIDPDLIRIKNLLSPVKITFDQSMKFLNNIITELQYKYSFEERKILDNLKIKGFPNLERQFGRVGINEKRGALIAFLVNLPVNFQSPLLLEIALEIRKSKGAVEAQNFLVEFEKAKANRSK